MSNSDYRILVVEDDEMLRDMHEMLFRDEGYQVDSAVDGNQALDLLHTHSYDLLATDLFMPEMNGFELILKCKAHFPKIKIMLVSGGGKELKAVHGENVFSFNNETVEIDVFLKKPFQLSEMLEYTEKLLK